MHDYHVHLHEHKHVHSKEDKKRVLNRLSKSIGHMESVKKMIEKDEDCSEVLIQLAAIKSEVNNTAKVILKQHMQHCIVEAIEHGDNDEVDQLNKAIDMFIK